MRITAIGLLTRDTFHWEDYVPEVLKFCDEFLVFQYGDNAESAKICWEAGALLVDEPLMYLGTSDTGTGLTTLHEEARQRGADAVFMADPTDKWVGDIEEVKRLLEEHEVVKSRLFRARVTEVDEEKSVFERNFFEPEYNHKVMFAQANPGRLYWGMYPYWPYGARSCVEYGTVKSYAMAQSKDSYKVVTLGSGHHAEPAEDVFKRSEDWIARDMKSQQGNDLITEDEFAARGVAL
jgi:hypothetical protein